MSIYATVGRLGLKRFNDDAYFELLIQAVPPHIQDVGTAWDFLPAPVHPDGHLFRAVFIVELNEPMGTARSSHEYTSPLIRLAGQEYRDVRFVDLMARLEEALDARYGVPEWKSVIEPAQLRWYID